MTNRTTFTRASATGNLQSLVTNYNANLDALEVELENSLSRKDNILPNSMEDELDMNGNDIINVNEIDVLNLTINGTPVQPFAGVTVASAFQSYTFTATLGQTSFSIAPFAAYVASVQVEVNGLALPPADISVSGTNVIIPACTAGDEVVIRRYTSAPSPFPSADDITYTPAGTTNTRSVQNKLREIVTVKDFGAVGDGVADDTVAIQNAIAYAKTLSCPHLIINSGTYYVTALLTFDLPTSSTIEFIGKITTNIASGPCIRIGSTTTNVFSLRVTGIKVQRLTNDTTSDTIGVHLNNIAASYVDVRFVSGFKDGLVCEGSQGNGGFSYNEVHLGFLHDNVRNLLLTASNGISGYCNENIFFGGTFNHSSSYPNIATTNIEIAHYASNVLNNNRIFSPSLEDNKALATAAIINGANNLIFHPRMEHITAQSTYPIIFTANSSECEVMGAGFILLDTNIQDLGSGNQYETRSGKVIASQAGAGSGNGVLKARSLATSAARVFVAEDTNKVARAWIRGDGIIESEQHAYLQNGVRWNTSSGTNLDRGIYLGSGSPEGVVSCLHGSLYVDQSSGTRLYVKESGGGNTGWVAASTLNNASIKTTSSGINATEAVVTSLSAPANSLKAGATYRIKASGVCTSTAANASDFRLRIGTTTLTGAIASVVTPTAAASGTAVPFSVELLVTIRSSGVGGTALGSGTLLNNGVTGVSAAAVVVGQVTTAVTVDTTAVNLIELTYQAAASTTTCTFYNATIEQCQ